MFQYQYQQSKSVNSNISHLSYYNHFFCSAISVKDVEVKTIFLAQKWYLGRSARNSYAFSTWLDNLIPCLSRQKIKCFGSCSGVFLMVFYEVSFMLMMVFFGKRYSFPLHRLVLLVLFFSFWIRCLVYVCILFDVLVVFLLVVLFLLF